MPIIVCFEGQLAARPETTHHDGEPAETITSAVTTAVITVPPPPGSRSSRKVSTTYHLRAHGHRALALAHLVDGDSVVVIGHVETEAIPNIGDDRSNTCGSTTPPAAPASPSSAGAPAHGSARGSAGASAGRRTYRDTVVVDSIGTSLTAGSNTA